MTENPRERAFQQLIQLGESQGFLTPEEIFGVLRPELVEELDELLTRLHRRNVPVVDSPESGARVARERRMSEPGPGTAGSALTSYLREISQLSSLDRETEIGYAREYRTGIVQAFRAVVDAQLFVDKLLQAGSRVRRERQSIWSVVDRLRYVADDEPERAREEFLELVQGVASLRSREKRILGRIRRRGTSEETARSLSAELKRVRNDAADKLVRIPFEPRFLEQIAADMIHIHQRLELVQRQRGEIAGKLGVAPVDLERFISRGRRAESPRIPDLDEFDRLLKNLRRRIRRIEKQSGMSQEGLHRAVLRYRGGILKAHQARDALILSAQRLVLSSARYYGRRLSGSGMEVADLISAGNLGLIRAVELFDPERGNRFSTFAGHWVRHAMIRTIHTQSRTVYVPPHIRQQMSKILAMENDLLQKLGRPPSDQELATASRMDIPRLRHTIQSFGRVSSIDRPLDPDDSGSATYGDVLADGGLTPDQELEGAERRALVRSLAERLQGRERTIVFMRMGWDNGDPMTLAEIGECFGISRQRVEQLEKRALSKLRRWAQTAGLAGDPFL